MLLIDSALTERQNSPIQVAVFGAGFISKGLVNKIANATDGMNVAVIVNRTAENAIECATIAGLSYKEVENTNDLHKCIDEGTVAIVVDPSIIYASDRIECVIEATGTIEYAAHVAVNTIESNKHLIMVNAELDAYVGPILLEMANRHGVIYTGADGDQPAVQMNLIRFVEGIGANPLVSGNIKGLLDRYRTPATQAKFAAQWGQTPEMVTSFADGTKIAFEQAVVANATGMSVAKRGMLGYEFDGFIDDATHLFDLDQLRETNGIVDYLVGAKPSPGVFVFAEYVDERQKQYLSYAKLGDGPLYSFYVPYHLLHFEVANSVARAVCFSDATVAPEHGLVVDVVAIAKRDLKAGQTLDGLGGFDTYGECETSEVSIGEQLLPIAMAENCVLKHDVPKDQALAISDVTLRSGYLADELRSKLTPS